MRETCFYGLLFSLSVSGQEGLQISSLNRAQAYIETPNYRSSFQDLFLFDITHTNFRLGGRFLINESTRYDTILGGRLTQRFFEYRGEPFAIHLGNFYEVFGQGLVLNSFEDEALGIDWNIDGIEGKLDYNRLAAKALIGRPRADNSSRNELIGGGELNLRLFLPYELGMSYLRFDATNTTKDISFGLPVEERVSIHQKLILGQFQLLAEAGRRFTWGRFDPNYGWVGTDNVNGYGLYLSSNFGLPGLGLFADYKDYTKFDGTYNALPPCSKTNKSLNRGSDERGFLTEVQLSPKNYLTLSSGLSRAWARNGRQSLNEWFTELRADLGFAILTPALLRTEEQNIEAAYPRKTEDILSLGLIFGSITANGEYKLVSDSLLNGEARRYSNRRFNLDYTWNLLTVIAMVEATDKPPDILEEENRWASVAMRLRLVNHDLQISYGSHRGQLECATGICRYEPPFRGLKVELESRF